MVVGQTYFSDNDNNAYWLEQSPKVRVGDWGPENMGSIIAAGAETIVRMAVVTEMPADASKCLDTVTG